MRLLSIPGKSAIKSTCFFFKWVVVLCVSTLGYAHADADYSVTFDGAATPELVATLQEYSDTYQMLQEPPASLVHLRRRVQRDEERFLSTLQSLGHFGAKLESTIEGDTPPYVVRFTIEPGPVYSIGEVSLPPLAEGQAMAPESVGLKTGDGATAARILQAEAKLAERFQEAGYPFASAGARRVVVDHATQSVQIALSVETGPRAVFGKVSIAGLDKVDAQVVEERLEWEEGAPFQRTLLRQTQRKLYDTGLFGLTSVSTADDVEPDGALPIYIELSERKHRTYAIGARFDTDQGAGFEFSWEHRNMRQLGHKLSVGARLSTEVSELLSTYQIDQYRREDQRLVSTFRIAREDLEAYESNRINISTLVERDVTPQLTLGAGLAVLISDTTQNRRNNTYHLLSAPLKADWNKSDDLLNPTEGFRLSGRVEPFADFLEGDAFFLKTDLTFTHYQPLNKDRSWILATRLRTGSIMGESLEGIPPSVRFYSGGGGSIRGFPYRTVSPLDSEDTPLGGRSTLEAAIEIRRRISETLGVVAFVDAGSAFDSPWPDFDESIRYAAGIGFRYFTTIGPLRFDVAVPLNKRDKIDDAFEFYLSIGQAF